MTKVYFSSDPHYFHNKILEKLVRPTDGKTNEEWLDSIYSTIEPGSTLYITGDLAMKVNLANYRTILQKFKDLGVTLYIVVGNHDNKNMLIQVYQEIFGHSAAKFVIDYLEIKPEIHGEQYKDMPLLVLSHYPFESWNKSRYGSINLHGHSHGFGRKIKNRLDVGVDVHHRPIELGEIMTIVHEQNVRLLESLPELPERDRLKLVQLSVFSKVFKFALANFKSTDEICQDLKWSKKKFNNLQKCKSWLTITDLTELGILMNKDFTTVFKEMKK